MNRNRQHKSRKVKLGIEQLDERAVPALMLEPGGLLGPFIPGQTGFVGPVTPNMGVTQSLFGFGTPSFATTVPITSPTSGAMFGPVQTGTTGTVPTLNLLHTGLRLGGMQFMFNNASRFGTQASPIAGLGPHVPARFGSFLHRFLTFFSAPQSHPHLPGFF